MPSHFTHLHLHTEYSLLDGAISIDELVSFAKKHQFTAMGISDHGNIFGAVKFFQKAHAAGIKPILGMEAYFTEDCAIKDANNKYYHLLLIVENEIGYRNLCKLLAHAYTTGFYFKPRIDYALLEKHAEGLIVTSACLGGHIPQLLMAEQEQEAYKRLQWFVDLLGPDRFYLEIQPPETEDQRALNNKLFSIGAKRGIKLIATADCHYVHQEDHYAHEVMLAVQTRHKMSDPDRFSFGDVRAYMRTADQMRAAFPDHPEVVWQSGDIADRCSFTFPKGKLYFPRFPLPTGITAEEYFTAQCHRGLDTLFAEGRIDPTQRTLYEERLALEMQLIITMGFVTYFLVVSDFMLWAIAHHIPVGPGRGSAAGSLVAWALRITDVDPIKYHLLFERFLNPERISMPDIDIDFCIEGRDKVISYVRERYGHDHVCQIITFGTMMAKGVVKDVARALGFPFEDSQAITDLISDQLKITLTEAIEQEPKLKQLIDTNPKVAELISIARRLEGLTRHASKHAAGVVITPQPVTDMLPVYVPPKTDELVTQYAMTELESLGFLKMDFLGLKNLTLIKQVTDAIAENHAVVIDITRLPLDDPKTFELLCRGETSGVFQLESSGLRDVLRRLQPEKFEDIIAVNALYRPGPLNSGMVDDFIARRHGKAEIMYTFPELKPILAETYGVIVYQEQVMHIASKIAGFSLGEADILRRAMGKKKAEEMAKQQAIFVSKAVACGFDHKKSTDLFNLMAYFAGYGFNKSHSTAYALIAYQTAYLKAHYPAEFMAALISLETGDPETMAAYLQDAKSMHIPVLAPDINRSMVQFAAHNQAILFGLQGIKNIGDAALREIIGKRSEKGPYKDLTDLCMRVDLRTVNKRVLESLLYAGALDYLPGTRAEKHASLTRVVEYALERKYASTTGQLTLFAPSPTEGTGIASTPPLPLEEAEPWSHQVTLDREKEVLGMYLSGHPLDAHMHYITALTHASDNTWSATLTTKKIITTKKGDPMAFLACTNIQGTFEVVIFPTLYKKIEPWLSQYTVFIIKGIQDAASQSLKIKAQDLLPLELVRTQGFGITEMRVTLPHPINPDLLPKLQALITTGQTALTLCFTGKQKHMQLAARTKITVTPELMGFAQANSVQVTLLW